MSPSNAVLRESIEIPRSPVLPSELTMRKYRVIVEDEKTGQEYKGYSGLNRVAVDRIIALIHSVGAHDLQAGSLPTGKNSERKTARWTQDVARKLDGRAAPKVAPRRPLGQYARKA